MARTCAHGPGWPAGGGGLALPKAGDGSLHEHVDGRAGPVIYRAACLIGLEGISKRVDRPYRSRRSPDLIKVSSVDERATLVGHKG